MVKIEFKDLISHVPDRILLEGENGCHEKGQPLLAPGGHSIAVQDVRPGDRLVGPDGPRTVLSLKQGKGLLYRIRPKKGTSFIVNEDHILTLRHVHDGRKLAGSVIDVALRDWLAWTPHMKRMFKLFHAPVTSFDRVGDRAIDPYYLGLYIGDGNAATASITTTDEEVVAAIKLETQRWGLRLAKYEYDYSSAPVYASVHPTQRWFGRNPLRRALAKLGVMLTDEKRFIPDAYKTAPKEHRLQLLAGLMDSDGHHNCGGFEHVTSSPRLAQDVTFLARSVGLQAYAKPTIKSCQTGATGTYWRTFISGDCTAIPTKIARKHTVRRRIGKDPLMVGFDVEYVGDGPYYGFTLSGDGRYLLDDFTVTHNSGKTNTCIRFAAEMLAAGQRGAFLDMVELGSALQVSRLAATGEFKADWAPRIDFHHVKTYVELEEYLKWALTASGNQKPQFLVVDPFHYVQPLARHHVKQAYLDQGFYESGGKVITIKNRDAFDLAGYMYGAANDREQRVRDLLLGVGCTVVATINPYFLKDEKVAVIEGAFDTVLNVSVKRDAKKVHYFMQVKKARGISWTNAEEQEIYEGTHAIQIFRALSEG